jgi:hypothetical protein
VLRPILGRRSPYRLCPATPPCSSGQYPVRGGDRPCLVPTGLSRRIGGAADTRQGSRDRRRPVGVRQRLTRPAREGWQIDAKGCGGASTSAAGAVGSERPGLKPRAQSASPLKGAVRRTGARVDRLGAGAVGISRLQPAWGLSPAVHGRAIVETGARLIGAACRARRVGHDRLPRRPARSGEAAPRPYTVGNPSPVGRSCLALGRWPRVVGVRRCLTRRPSRAGERHRRRSPMCCCGHCGATATVFGSTRLRPPTPPVVLTVLVRRPRGAARCRGERSRSSGSHPCRGSVGGRSEGRS